MHRLTKATHAICIFLIAVCGAALYATDYYGQPGEFLRYSPSARALALGRAYTAIGQDANALHWNPGALGQLRRTGLSMVGTQASLFGQANYSCLSIGLPFEIINSPIFQRLNNLTLGASFLNLTSDITEADEFGIVHQNSILSSSQGAFSLALATSNNIRYLNDFSLGAGIDVIWNNIYEQKKTAIGFNAGIYYHNDEIDFLNWFTFALAFKNINKPDLALDSRYEEIVPMTGRLGLAFLPPFCSCLPSALRPLLVSLDYDVVTLSGVQRGIYLGLEYNISRLQGYLPLRLRLGTNTKESSFTFGLSLDLPSNAFMKTGHQYLPTLDYSFNFYEDNDYLGDVKQGGISFAWTPKTPADWYAEAMQLFPENLLSSMNAADTLSLTRARLQRVFDNPQALSNPNYSHSGYDALLRLGDLAIADAWLANDRDALLRTALKNYDEAERCLSLTSESADERNRTSLLYRLQGEMRHKRSTAQLFGEPYVDMIDDQQHVQFLRGYSYYLEGDTTQAIAEWRSLELPVANYFAAKVTKDSQKLLEIAFSKDTKVSQKILYPLIPDFDIADNALYEFAKLTNSQEWLFVISKLFPLSDVHNKTND
ncbi:hypothetical protein JXA02_01130 [candidate division KSB1 bacterium]|nr:hypothetical protein [candidate division KSB1 bacterium]RQW11054.1 MAG: hypothetical protein EH222_01205 [candidate division KSB1 bacterium]